MIMNWSEKWRMEFNIKKCKLMHIGRDNRNIDCVMRGSKLQVIDSEKDLDIIIMDDGKNSRQCLCAYNNSIRILGMSNRTSIYKEKKVLVNLYKTLLRPHLEYCMSVWSPRSAKDKELLEKI